MGLGHSHPHKDTPCELHYFNIKALGYGPMAVGKLAGLNMKRVNVAQEDGSLAALKPQTPFGQVPYLVHGDVKMAQARAICHYLAHVGGLNHGLTDKELALSEMLFEESADIFANLPKFNYLPETTPAEKDARKAAVTAAFSELARHLALLEKLIGEGPYFKNDRRLAGGVYLVATLDLFVGMRPDCLDSFPKMKHFYTTIMASPVFDDIRDLPAWFMESRSLEEKK